MSGAFCYLWSYRVRSDSVAEFESAYGPEGDWVALFRRDPAYICTTLLHDSSDPLRYVTLDFWTSREARNAFRELFRFEFDALDVRCEAFTETEEFIGDFDIKESSV